MKRARPQSELARQEPFSLSCDACQNLRRATRLVTRLYDQELRKAGIEIAQFGLMMAISKMGEANQKTLSAALAIDSTTLTRNLSLLLRRGWIDAKPGKDKRERLLRLTAAGRQQLTLAQPHWQRAERRLQKAIGESGWELMHSVVGEITRAAADA